MRSWRWATGLVTAMMVLGVAACDGDSVEGVLFFDPGPKELAGVWTGREEISGESDGVSNLNRDDGFEDGFSFPVSLVLRKDRTFTLRSFGYPVNGGELCRGIYVTDGRTLEFYPNRDCRALPLNRYTIGRFFPDGLTLVARTGATVGLPEAGGASVRVHIRVERD